MIGLLADVDSLFETAVMTPDAMTEQAITDWMAGVAMSRTMDKETAKYLRRLVRTAEKLAAFWDQDRRVEDADLDWRTRVDIAMGPRAWRPVLDLSQHMLELQPSEDVYVAVGELFRIVNREPWLEGMAYEDWLQERNASENQE